jgi:GLPGLI family protein
MKRTLIICFLFLLFAGKLYSQYFPPHYFPIEKYKVIDSAYLKVSYQLTSIKDSSDLTKKYTDLEVLLIGNQTSKYFSQYVLDYNIETQKLLKKGNQSVPNNPRVGAYGYEIFKNIRENTITVTDLGSRLNGNFQYKDDIKNFNWEIKDDTMTFLSYPCRKAVCEFRGRKYEAWFTIEIPVNNGPWKFSGLPGLILKVNDLQKQYVFECIGLESLHENEPVKFYELEYSTISRTDLSKLYRKMHEDSSAYFSTQGIRTMELNPKTNKFETVSKSAIILPYNPIELE